MTYEQCQTVQAGVTILAWLSFILNAYLIIRTIRRRASYISGGMTLERARVACLLHEAATRAHSTDGIFDAKDLLERIISGQAPDGSGASL